MADSGQSGVFQKVFEEIVQRCLEAGLVEGRNLAVDGTLVGASASQQGRVPPQRLAEAAQVSRTVQEYLKELEQENPVTDVEQRSIAQEKVSTTDPDAVWAVKSGPATLGHYDNYLVDTTSRVILSVEPTPARFRQEMLAARRMLERVSHFGIRPQNLAADKAYGSGEFLAGLLERTFSPTFRSSIVSTKHEGVSVEMRSAMSPRKMPTTARKENHCTIEGSGAVVRAISIAQRKRSVTPAHRRSHVPKVPIGDCLFIGRSRRDKQFARWLAHLTISARNERATRSKLCSPSSNNRSSCAEFDCGDCGTSLSNSTWRPQPKI